MTFTDSTRYSRSRHFWSLCNYGSISYLRYLVSEIFSVEKYRNLEIPVKSQSRSLKVVPFDRLEYGFTLVFCSNFILIFDLKYAVTLKTGWESVKVIEMSPFDRAPMTSCWRYIVTMAISYRFWDIQCRKYRDLEIRVRGHSRSLKVVPLVRLSMVPIENLFWKIFYSPYMVAK